MLPIKKGKESYAGPEASGKLPGASQGEMDTYALLELLVDGI